MFVKTTDNQAFRTRTECGNNHFELMIGIFREIGAASLSGRLKYLRSPKKTF